MSSVWSKLRFDMLLFSAEWQRRGRLARAAESRGQGEFFPKCVPGGGKLHTYIQSWGWSTGGQEEGPCETGEL